MPAKRLADQLLWRQCCCRCQRCIWLPEHCQGQGQRHESKLTVCTCGVDNEDGASSSKLHSTLSRWPPKMWTWLSVNQSPPPIYFPAFLVSLSKCMNINPGKLIVMASESHILVEKNVLVLCLWVFDQCRELRFFPQRVHIYQYDSR